MKKVPVVIGIVSIVAAVGLFFGFSKSGTGELPDGPIDETDPKYQNTMVELPTSGSPKDFSAKNNIFISNYLYAQNELIYQSATTGKVKAMGTTQDVVNRKIVNEDEAFTEALSVGIIKVGTQRYVTQSDYLFRKGSKVTINGAEWSDNISVLTKDGYLEKFGGLPFAYSNYIINDLSIVDAKEISSSDDTYVYEYTLDTEIAPARYSYEVLTMSNGAELPNFKKSTVLTVTMDSSWRLLKINTKEEYSIVRKGMEFMGSITCVGDLEETFTYTDAPIEIPERSEFEPFFGANPSEEVEEEKGVIDYLGEAFLPLMSNDSSLYLNGSVSTNPTKSYDIKAKLNIKNSEFEFLFDNKIYAYLVEDDAVMKYNDIIVGVSKDELMNVLSSYLPKSDDGSAVDITSLVSLDSLTPMLDNATLVKSDDEVIVSLPIENILDVEIILGIDETGTSYLKTIKGNMTSNQNYSFEISVSSDPISFPMKPEEVNYITNIEDIKNDITSIVENKAISANIDFAIPLKDNETLGVSGDLYFDFNDTKNLLAQGDISIVYGLEQYDLSLSYVNNTMYVSYEDNINIKLSVEEVKALVSDITTRLGVELESEIKVPDIDLLSFLGSVNIDSLLKSFSSDSNGFELLFNLSQFNIDEDVSLGYNVNEGFILDSSYGKVVVNAHEPLVIEEDKTITYIGYEEISGYINTIDALVSSKRFDIAIDVNVMANGKLLSIRGNALVDIENGLDFAIEGYISYADILDNVEFSLKKIDNTYYLHFANSYFALTSDEIISFFNDLNSKYNLGLDSLFALVAGTSQMDTSILKNISIKDIIDSICLGKEIELDFDASSLGYKNLDVKLDSSTGIITVSSPDFAITLSKSDNLDEIVKDENVVYQTIRSLEQMQVTIEKLLEQKYYQGVISSDLVNGSIYVDISDINNIYAYVKGMLTYQNENIDIYLEYKDGKISLASDSIGIRVSPSEIKEIIDLLDKEFNLGLSSKLNDVQEQSKDISISETISQILDTLTISDTSINLTYVGQDSIGSINVEVALGNTPSLSLSNDMFSLSVETSEKQEVVMPNTYYASVNEVKALISKAKALSETRLFTVSINVSTLLNGAKFEMSGTLSIDLSNGIDVQGDLDIVYDSIRAQVEIAKIGDKLYLHTESLNFTFSYGELKDFLRELNTRYKLGLDLNALPETLDLPSSSKVNTSSINVIKLIKMISINETGVIANIDTSVFGLSMGNVIANIPYVGNIANISNEHLSLGVDYGSELSFTPLDAKGYLGYEDAIKVCDLVDNAINQFKVNKTVNEDGSTTYEEKTIHFTFDANIFNTAVSTTSYRFNAKADVFINVLSNGHLSVKLDLDVTGESNHTIDLIYVDGTIYCTYNGVNLAIDWQTLIQTLRYANDTFKFIKGSTADMIFDILGSTEELDSSIFDNFMPSGESEPMLITNVLKSLEVSDDTFKIKMNNSVIYGFDTSYDTTGAIIMNNNKITSIDIGYAYTSATEYLSPRIAFDELTCDEIVAPSGTYQKFDNLDSLLKSFVKSAELRNYDIEGKIILDFSKVPGIGWLINLIANTEVPVRAQISVDENNAIRGHINMVIPRKAAGAIKGSTLNMYIEDDMLYIHDYYDKADHYEKWTVSEYFGRGNETIKDIIGLLHLGSIIENPILEAINEPKTTKPTFEKSFVGYNSPSIGTYNIILNGGDLASTDDIGNINLTLNSNSDGYLEKISDISVLMVKYIQLTANFNLVDGSIGNEVVVAQPDYSKY